MLVWNQMNVELHYFNGRRFPPYAEESHEILDEHAKILFEMIAQQEGAIALQVPEGCCADWFKPAHDVHPSGIARVKGGHNTWIIELDPPDNPVRRWWLEFSILRGWYHDECLKPYFGAEVQLRFPLPSYMSWICDEVTSFNKSNNKSFKFFRGSVTGKPSGIGLVDMVAECNKDLFTNAVVVCLRTDMDAALALEFTAAEDRGLPKTGEEDLWYALLWCKGSYVLIRTSESLGQQRHKLLEVMTPRVVATRTFEQVKMPDGRSIRASMWHTFGALRRCDPPGSHAHDDGDCSSSPAARGPVHEPRSLCQCSCASSSGPISSSPASSSSPHVRSTPSAVSYTFCPDDRVKDKVEPLISQKDRFFKVDAPLVAEQFRDFMQPKLDRDDSRQGGRASFLATLPASLLDNIVEYVASSYQKGIIGTSTVSPKWFGPEFEGIFDVQDATQFMIQSFPAHNMVMVLVDQRDDVSRILAQITVTRVWMSASGELGFEIIKEFPVHKAFSWAVSMIHNIMPAVRVTSAVCLSNPWDLAHRAIPEAHRNTFMIIHRSQIQNSDLFNTLAGNDTGAVHFHHGVGSTKEWDFLFLFRNGFRVVSMQNMQQLQQGSTIFSLCIAPYEYNRGEAEDMLTRLHGVDSPVVSSRTMPKACDQDLRRMQMVLTRSSVVEKYRMAAGPVLQPIVGPLACITLPSTENTPVYFGKQVGHSIHIMGTFTFWMQGSKPSKAKPMFRIESIVGSERMVDTLQALSGSRPLCIGGFVPDTMSVELYIPGHEFHQYLSLSACYERGDRGRRRKLLVIDQRPFGSSRVQYDEYILREDAKFIAMIGHGMLPFSEDNTSADQLKRWANMQRVRCHRLLEICRTCKEACGVWAMQCSICFHTYCVQCFGDILQGASASAAAGKSLCTRCRRDTQVFPTRRMCILKEHRDIETIKKLTNRQWTHPERCAQCQKSLPSSVARRYCDCLIAPHYCSSECFFAHRDVHVASCSRRHPDRWSEDFRRFMDQHSPMVGLIGMFIVPRDAKKGPLPEEFLELKPMDP